MSSRDPLDYRKVIIAVAKTLNASRDVTIDASHSRADIFDVTTAGEGGAPVKYRLEKLDAFMMLTIGHDIVPDPAFKRWIANFEYELEQTFLTNIRLETTRESSHYRVKINL